MSLMSMNTKTKINQSTWEIFCWPLIINCICLVGVLAALIGDGGWDVLSWLCLGITAVGLVYAITSFRFKSVNRFEAKTIK